VQETFLAVHQGLDRFQENSKLTTWMWSLAHHKVCDRLSDKHRRHSISDEPDENTLTSDDSEETWESPTAWDSGPGRLVDRRRAEAHLPEAIAALGQPARDVYLLRDGQGLSGEDVAEILGLTPVNVRVHLHRARHKIVEFVRARIHSAPTEKPSQPSSSPLDSAPLDSHSQKPSHSVLPQSASTTLFGGPEP
jgi:RNA polymerase sigma-70 factor (ECF subfamily)